MKQRQKKNLLHIEQYRKSRFCWTPWVRFKEYFYHHNYVFITFPTIMLESVTIVVKCLNICTPHFTLGFTTSGNKPLSLHLKSVQNL